MTREVDQLSTAGLFFSGIFLILVFISFFLFSVKKVNFTDSYKFDAFFNSIDGINDSSKVTISGIEVGWISKISLSKDNQVKVEGYINNEYKLASDSILKIDTYGIFGKKYFSIIPGYDELVNVDTFNFLFTSDSYTVDFLARYLEGNRLNEK